MERQPIQLIDAVNNAGDDLVVSKALGRLPKGLLNANRSTGPAHFV